MSKAFHSKTEGCENFFMGSPCSIEPEPIQIGEVQKDNNHSEVWLLMKKLSNR